MQSQKSILALCSEHSPVASTSETALFNHKRQGEAGGGQTPPQLPFSEQGCFLLSSLPSGKEKRVG